MAVFKSISVRSVVTSQNMAVLHLLKKIVKGHKSNLFGLREYCMILEEHIILLSMFANI